MVVKKAAGGPSSSAAGGRGICCGASKNSASWTAVRKLQKRLAPSSTTDDCSDLSPRPSRICGLFVRFHDMISEELEDAGRGKFTVDNNCLDCFNALVNDFSEQLITLARRETVSRCGLSVDTRDVEAAAQKILGRGKELTQICVYAIQASCVKSASVDCATSHSAGPLPPDEVIQQELDGGRFQEKGIAGTETCLGADDK